MLASPHLKSESRSDSISYAMCDARASQAQTMCEDQDRLQRPTCGSDGRFVPAGSDNVTPQSSAEELIPPEVPPPCLKNQRVT